MSRDRETYLKFKPMADDLRKAESWCESDGVLNRNKTMQNLYKMSYRKQSEGEWVEHSNWAGSIEYKCMACKETTFHAQHYAFCPNCGAKMKGGAE